MKKMIRSATEPSINISAAVAKTYDRHFSYSRGGVKYMVYVKHEDNPEWFQFSVSEIHPYDLAEYAWAQKTSPVDLEIIKDGRVMSRIPLPEWDWDSYEDENEYYDELIDMACAALSSANEGVEPLIDRT